MSIPNVLSDMAIDKPSDLAITPEAGFDAQPFPVIVVNDVAETVFVNERAATVFGYDRAAMKQCPLGMFFPAFTAAMSGRKFIEFVQENNEWRSLGRDRNGQDVAYIVTFRLLKPNEEPLVVCCVLPDTTESVRVQSIEEAQGFLSATLDALSAHVAVLAPNGTILSVNNAWRAFARDNGVSSTDFIGSNYLDQCHSGGRDVGATASRVLAGLEALIQGRSELLHLEYPCSAPNEERWFSLRATAFDEPPPRRLVVAHTNITSRKIAEMRMYRRFEAQKLISDLSTKFIDLPRERSDAAIQDAFAIVVNALEADRAYWLQFDPHEHHLVAAYAYASPTLPPSAAFPLETWRCCLRGSKPLLHEQTQFVEAILPQLSPNRPLCISSLRVLDQGSTMQLALAWAGVRSVMSVPVVFGRRVVGFFAVDTVRTEKTWSEDDTMFMQSIPEIMMMAMSRWRSEELLHGIVNGVGLAMGAGFFRMLVEQLRQSLDVDYALVAEVRDDGEAQCLACVGLEGTIEIPQLCLATSPAADIVEQGEPYVYRKDVRAKFPKDEILARLDVVGWVGVPLVDAEDRTIGYLVVMNRRVLASTKLIMNVLRVFGTRAASEIDLRRKHDALVDLNRALEERVVERANVAARQAAAMDAATEGMAILSADTYVYMNDAHARMFGYPSGKSMLGRSWHELFPTEERKKIATEVLPELHRARTYRGEHRGLRRDGTIFDVHLAFGYAERGDLICCCKDITEEKRVQRELSAHRDELRQANLELARAAQLKDEFLASMSHELRTPLNAVIGMSEVLLNQMVGPINEKQQSCLQVVDESGKHLLALINDILDLSKIEAGTLGLELSSFDVRALCEACLRLVQPAADAKMHRLYMNFGPAAGRIHADERRLKQMLVNLLDNAIKFTPPGGMVGLDIVNDVPADRIAFVVWDNGIGISADKLHLLFKPFSQVDQGLARQQEGAGLGLSLVKRMAELHDGSVSVESAEGKGSRFILSLPRRRKGAQSKSTSKMQASKSSPRDPLLVASTVLVIDDNASNVAVLREYLTAKGYEVYTASSALEGIDLLSLIPCNAIFMDIQMPGMDGLEAIRLLRKDKQFEDLPIIAVTALAMPGDRERCFAAGATEYVRKPLSPKEIGSLLEKLLHT